MRRDFPTAVKVAAFQRAKGRCEGCTGRLFPGKFRYDHIIPDWMGGEPTLENCRVSCLVCDAPKTRKDQGDIAKVKRVRAKHLGAKARSRSPMPCGKQSKFKKKFTGEVVLR